MADERKADEYVVIRHRPGYRLRRSLILLVFSVISAVLGYAVGMAEDGFRFSSVVETRDSLKRELTDLREVHTESQQRLINLERGRSIDEQALNQARRAIMNLETRIAELESDLTFYRNIMAPSETNEGLQVDKMTLRPTRGEGRYDFKLVLTQVGNNKSYISGLVAVNVVGMRNDEKEVIALRDLSEDIEDLGVRFRFRYFQDVEGELRVPEGFEPQEIQVVAQAEGAKSTKAERTFDWTALTEK